MLLNKSDIRHSSPTNILCSLIFLFYKLKYNTVCSAILFFIHVTHTESNTFLSLEKTRVTIFKNSITIFKIIVLLYIINSKIIISRDDSMNIQIGQIIRDYRKTFHYTQEELAEKIDKSSGYIGQIERNETSPSLNTFARLISVLNIDPNTIFFDTESDNSNELLLNEISLRVSKLSVEKQEFLLELIKTLEKHTF